VNEKASWQAQLPLRAHRRQLHNRRRSGHWREIGIRGHWSWEVGKASRFRRTGLRPIGCSRPVLSILSRQAPRKLTSSPLVLRGSSSEWPVIRPNALMYALKPERQQPC